MNDFKAAIASARLPERTVQVCLRGDLQAAYEQAERDYQEAKRHAGDSLAGGGIRDAAKRMDDLREQMKEHTYDFVIRGLPRPRWTELVAKNPPRKDNVRDQMSGYNVESLAEALLREGTVSPEVDDDDWTALFGGVLTRGQFVELANGAYAVNESGVSVPFSLEASQTLSSTDAG